MSIGWSWPRETRYQRAASTPIFSTSSCRKTTSPAAFGDPLLLAVLDEMDELVDQDLDPVGVVTEQARCRPQTVDIAVVVGAEHVDRPVEPALELVAHVGDVGGEVEVAAVLGTQERAILVVAELGRARPAGALGLVGVDLLQHLGHLQLDLFLAPPAVHIDAECLELSRDLVEHQLDGVAVHRCELDEVLADVALLGRILPAPAGLDRGAEELDLAADVVEVVLALDLVPGELEQARDRVAVWRRCAPSRR